MKIRKCNKCQKEYRAYTRNGIIITKFCDNCLHEKQKRKIKKYLTTKKYKKEVKNETEKLRKKCVKLAKEISKKKQGNKCQYCGNSQRQIHSHHIFSEGLYRSMSADVDNLISLCAIHHTGGQWGKSPDNFSFHTAPRESTEWYIKNFPENYQKLLKRSRKLVNLDFKYWENKFKKLKKQLKKL